MNSSYEDGLSTFVTDRIHSIHGRSSRGASDGKAILSALRRGQDIGVNPNLWLDTLDLPERYQGLGDTPSAAEQGAFAALTLWSLHQQSRTSLVHQSGARFGAQAAALVQRTGRLGAVQRRLYALSMASNINAVLAHGRGIVSQLRDHNLDVDYGQFAVDISNLLRPKFAPGTRVRWGRDFATNTNPTNTHK